MNNSLIRIYRDSNVIYDAESSTTFSWEEPVTFPESCNIEVTCEDESTGTINLIDGSSDLLEFTDTNVATSSRTFSHIDSFETTGLNTHIQIKLNNMSGEPVNIRTALNIYSAWYEQKRTEEILGISGAMIDYDYMLTITTPKADVKEGDKVEIITNTDGLIYDVVKIREENVPFCCKNYVLFIK